MKIQNLEIVFKSKKMFLLVVVIDEFSIDIFLILVPDFLRKPKHDSTKKTRKGRDSLRWPV